MTLTDQDVDDLKRALFTQPPQFYKDTYAFTPAARCVAAFLRRNGFNAVCDENTGAVTVEPIPNRLYYVWTEGHGGATGEAPGRPRRHGPVSAAASADAAAKIKPKLSSWDGPIKMITTDENYAPRAVVIW